jgi:hypothetical protein
LTSGPPACAAFAPRGDWLALAERLAPSAGTAVHLYELASPAHPRTSFTEPYRCNSLEVLPGGDLLLSLVGAPQPLVLVHPDGTGRRPLLTP